MIEVRNLQVYEGMEFPEYWKLPGYSFSSFKSYPKGFEPTYKMKLGSALDAYLTEPAKYDGFEYEMIRPAAAMVREKMGPIWSHLKKQLSIGAEFHTGGFMMRYRGRPDFAIPGKIVIDLKFVDDEAGMGFFDYPSQLAGYCIALSAPTAFILEMSRKKKAARFIPVRITQDFWIQKTLLHGTIY